VPGGGRYVTAVRAGVCAGRAEGPGRVDVRHYRDHFVEVTTAATGRRLLVFADLYYPGWSAEIEAPRSYGRFETRTTVSSAR
jgi:hypothetical protein